MEGLALALVSWAWALALGSRAVSLAQGLFLSPCSLNRSGALVALRSWALAVRSWPLGFVALGLVLSCWTVALRSWASALRKSSASGSDLLRRLGLSIGIAVHRHFCTSERRYDGTTVRRNDARDGGRFSAPLRASSIYIYTYTY